MIEGFPHPTGSFVRQARVDARAKEAFEWANPQQE